jgi:hypothetical protein
VHSTVDAACALSLCSTEFEGGAIRFEDFLRRVVAEVSSPLVRSSRTPEHSAMLCSADPGNRLLTISVKLTTPAFGTLLQLEKRGICQDNEKLSRLKKAAVFEFFEAH